MIAVDTNVLVRYLVRDDAAQAEAARLILEGVSTDRPCFICREVALEVVWVLERAYRFTREQIADVIVELSATEGIVIEEMEEVTRSAIRYRQSNADFSDLMILAAAQRAGAEPLYTFDRRLARVEGAALVDASEL